VDHVLEGVALPPQPPVEAVAVVAPEPGEERQVVGSCQHVDRVDLGHPETARRWPSADADVIDTSGRGRARPWAASARRRAWAETEPRGDLVWGAPRHRGPGLTRPDIAGPGPEAVARPRRTPRWRGRSTPPNGRRRRSPHPPRRGSRPHGRARPGRSRCWDRLARPRPSRRARRRTVARRSGSRAGARTRSSSATARGRRGIERMTEPGHDAGVPEVLGHHRASVVGPRLVHVVEQPVHRHAGGSVQAPDSTPSPVPTTAYGSARVEAATRAASVEAASSWSASNTSAALSVRISSGVAGSGPSRATGARRWRRSAVPRLRRRGEVARSSCWVGGCRPWWR
jgi:hypothetical protein